MSTTSFGTRLPTPPPKTGAELIALERDEQINEHGYDATHDDLLYGYLHNAELLRAASIYLVYAATQVANPTAEMPSPQDWLDSREHAEWPWAPSAFRPSEDPEKNLTKAGALIAAQIDVLQSGIAERDNG